MHLLRSDTIITVTPVILDSFEVVQGFSIKYQIQFGDGVVWINVTSTIFEPISTPTLIIIRIYYHLYLAYYNYLNSNLKDLIQFYGDMYNEVTMLFIIL